MRKFKKLTALLIAVIVVVGAFAPAALAWTYAPTSWEDWPLQRRNYEDTMYAVAIQVLLNGNRGSGLTVDGDFGSATESAVKAFQNDWNLDDDGILGEDTWNAMQNRLSGIRHFSGGELFSSSNNSSPRIITEFYIKQGMGNYYTTSLAYFRKITNWEVLSKHASGGITLDWEWIRK